MSRGVWLFICWVPMRLRWLWLLQANHNNPQAMSGEMREPIRRTLKSPILQGERVSDHQKSLRLTALCLLALHTICACSDNSNAKPSVDANTQARPGPGDTGKPATGGGATAGGSMASGVGTTGSAGTPALDGGVGNLTTTAGASNMTVTNNAPSGGHVGAVTGTTMSFSVGGTAATSRGTGSTGEAAGGTTGSASTAPLVCKTPPGAGLYPTPICNGNGIVCATCPTDCCSGYAVGGMCERCTMAGTICTTPDCADCCSHLSREGICIDCASNAQCHCPSACHSNRCTKTADGVACAYADCSDCDSATSINNVCVPQCATDAECYATQNCRSGRCITQVASPATAGPTTVAPTGGSTALGASSAHGGAG